MFGSTLSPGLLLLAAHHHETVARAVELLEDEGAGDRLFDAVALLRQGGELLVEGLKWLRLRVDVLQVVLWSLRSTRRLGLTLPGLIALTRPTISVGRLLVSLPPP